MREPRSYIKAAAIIIFVAALCLYTLYQSRFLISGPGLTIDAPRDGALVTEKLVYVSGSVTNAAFIYLNDRQIFTDQKGNFHELLLASPGYNIMTLRVKDSLGRERRQTRQFIYNEPAGTAAETASSSPVH